ncbi:CAP domain-containing protein [Sporosarcina sp. G11-34]|uniref:CAP domain-containing protein n=1 Tax=Sporosarcina sp. G11-34 TaxID=2849605 RepID=UPI0022A92217|nr:CAP-associated domain-containing protein [Sporosarcina sp. G11-34]MCZ2258900.1 hypothetical protein [Sporosarcina sp. G11-34]
MKVFWRIIILLIVVLLLFYCSDSRIKENKLLESPVKQGAAVPVPDKGVGAAISQTERPEKGLSTFVGEHAEKLIEKYGKPTRKEPSAYGYEWWVYLGNLHFMAGVTDKGVVNQVYTAENTADVAPFVIGQDIQDIYRFTIVGSEIDVVIDENVYTFSLNSDDLQNRLLIIYKDLYTQLYIDGVEGKLVAVRFLDPETLVLHQPYGMTYMGDLLTPPVPSSTKQLEVDWAAERQIFELTNGYRKKYGVEGLENDYRLTVVARQNSVNEVLEGHSSYDSVESNSLTDRLKEAMIEHRGAGENIALDYVDGIEAVHGWLNSPAHRNVLLDKNFTHVGIGAYGKYYTQDLVHFNKKDLKQQ